MTFISRRDLLKRTFSAAAVATSAAHAFGSESPIRARSTESLASQTGRPLRREPLENLTAEESEILDAVVARLIPTDEHGPGATEARAAHYIDRALGGALASSRPAYAAGLAALDRYARSSRGVPFAQLSPVD